MLLQSSILLLAVITIIIPGSQTTGNYAEEERTLPECPGKKWWRVDYQCFGLIGKVEATDWLDWSSAREYCQSSELLDPSAKGDLAQPEKIVELAKKIKANSKKNAFWLGSKKTDGVWDWGDGDVNIPTPTSTDRHNWALGHPKTGMDNEGCLAIYVGESLDQANRNALNDIDCNTKLPFVCERH